MHFLRTYLSAGVFLLGLFFVGAATPRRPPRPTTATLVSLAPPAMQNLQLAVVPLASAATARPLAQAAPILTNAQQALTTVLMLLVLAATRRADLPALAMLATPATAPPAALAAQT
jgi:mannose/fructose/N-acetylgalactosamine-specific phosphotransferase system component IIC